MRKILTIIVVSFCFISCNGQTKLAGKTYVAKIVETCKDGIGMIYISKVLEFDEYTVTSSFKVTASVSPELKDKYVHMYDHLTKTYKWKIDKGVLIFENCKEFGALNIQKSKISAKDNDWNTTVEFIEQTK